MHAQHGDYDANGKRIRHYQDSGVGTYGALGIDITSYTWGRRNRRTCCERRSRCTAPGAICEEDFRPKAGESLPVHTRFPAPRLQVGTGLASEERSGRAVPRSEGADEGPQVPRDDASRTATAVTRRQQWLQESSHCNERHRDVDVTSHSLETVDAYDVL